MSVQTVLLECGLFSVMFERGVVDCKKNVLNEKAGHLDIVPSFNLNLSEPWRRISFDMQINRLCKQTITDKGSEGRDGGGEFIKSV